jgi:hypothetical protein
VWPCSLARCIHRVTRPKDLVSLRVAAYSNMRMYDHVHHHDDKLTDLNPASSTIIGGVRPSTDSHLIKRRWTRASWWSAPPSSSLWTIGASARALSKAQESAASVGTLVLQNLQIHKFRKWRCAALLKSWQCMCVCPAWTTQHHWLATAQSNACHDSGHTLHAWPSCDRQSIRRSIEFRYCRSTDRTSDTAA